MGQVHNIRLKGKGRKRVITSGQHGSVEDVGGSVWERINPRWIAFEEEEGGVYCAITYY